MSLSACLRTVVLGGVMLLAACGGGGVPTAPFGGGDGDGDGDGGVGGTNPSSNMGGPNITVVSPKEALDPVKQEVVVGATWLVQCKVTQRDTGSTVDTGTIRAEVYVPGVAMPVASVAALSEGDKDIYSASVQLNDVMHGKIYAGCSAADINMRTNVQVVDTFLDKGPSLEIKTPTDGNFLKKTVIPIVVKVGLARLRDGDSEAGVAEISALVNGDVVRLSSVKDSPGEYAGEVNLTNDDSPPPELAIEVSATNKRTPTAAVSKLRLAAPVDAKAPTVTIKSPVPSEIVGNGMLIEANVEDPEIIDGVSGSGVDAFTVKAVVTGNGPSETFDMEVNGTTFSVRLPNVEKYVNEGSKQLKVNVLASDLAGNVPEMDSAAGVSVYLDTVPPYVSLDPGLFREIKLDNDESKPPKCSIAYDPLGSRMPDDGDVASEPTLRALAWDRALPAEVIYISHVDEASVAIHVQSNPDIPLLVTGSDGKCDTSPGPGATKLNLEPLAENESQGYMWTRTDFDDPPTNQVCTAVAETTDDTAEQLCDGVSDLWRVLRHEYNPEPSVIYGIPELAGDVCTGTYYQLPTAPGWKCIVATARDTVGNPSISAPLRLCVGTLGTDCPNPAPTCTDGCELASVYTSTTDIPNKRTEVPSVITRDP